MRTNTSSLSGVVNQIDESEGYRSTYPTVGDITVVSETRSDIIRTTRDASGWRQPTRYTAHFRKYVPWEGTCYWKDSYKTWGGGTAWVKKTFTGHLELIPGSSNAYYLPPVIKAPPVTSNNFRSRAINQALTKLKDQQVQYAVFLAEAGASSSMIVKNVKALVTAMRHVRKGRFTDAANALRISSKVFKRPYRRPQTERELSSRWLEAQYGWLPLLSDIYGAYEDIQKGFFREPRLSSFARVGQTSSTTTRERYNAYDITYDSEVTDSYFVRLDYVLSSSKLGFAVQKGLTNPLEVAWELVPFSFVWDWFNPVGEFLSCLDADFAVDFKGGTVTYYRKTNVVASLEPVPWTSNEIHQYSVGGSAMGALSEVSVNREVLPSSPSGSLYIKNPLSLMHVANATALLHQMFQYRK